MNFDTLRHETVVKSSLILIEHSLLNIFVPSAPFLIRHEIVG